MVFQDGALFPHLDVAGNVSFGRPSPGRVKACLDLVGLADRAGSFPHELSGGERQRVALARALAPEPDVVLLDEPFASLDAGLRVALRADVARILRDAGATGLIVTHDQQEALSLADVVVVLHDGAVEQIGTPQEVYDRPRSRWAAEFLGAATVLPGVAASGMVCCDLGRLPVEGGPDGDVEVIVRPEQVRVTDLDPSDGDAVSATVLDAAYFGHDHLLDLTLPGGAVVQSRGPGRPLWERGRAVAVRVDGPVTVVERHVTDR
jgi:iron(III) transport system ATP-binding protein